MSDEEAGEESWNSFPKSIVATLEQLASASSWLAANERNGNDKDAARDKTNIELYTRELGKQLDENDFTSDTHYLIVDLFKFGAWHAANERFGYKKDAEKDATKVGCVRLATHRARGSRIYQGQSASCCLARCPTGPGSLCSLIVSFRARHPLFRAQVREITHKLNDEGDITSDLTEKLKDLAIAYGWHAANTRKGYKSDATNDMDRVKVLLSQMTDD
jgi:hypothetical protein